MNHLITFFICFIIILIFGILFLLLQKKPHLKAPQREEAIRIIKSTAQLHPEHGLIKSHKAFIQALKSINTGYQQLTAAQVTAKIQDKLPNPKNIWRFHGLRNKAAHNPSFRIYRKTADEAREEYIKTLEIL